VYSAASSVPHTETSRATESLSRASLAARGFAQNKGTAVGVRPLVEVYSDEAKPLLASACGNFDRHLDRQLLAGLRRSVKGSTRPDAVAHAEGLLAR
jgi:hypothetical protein